MEYTLRILRGQPKNQYWEEFSLPLTPYENVISALMKLRIHPVNKEGKEVDPVVWEDGCLEEVCGSCSILINGVPRQACVALIESVIKETGSNVITLAPLSKFPLIRDLMVDRTQMFENLKRVQGWIEEESSKGPGPKVSPEKQEIMYAISRCMTCGCCAEACPQVNESSSFMGPAPIAQVRLFNIHPGGEKQAKERLKALMKPGGMDGCGNAHNCVRICPKEVPLVESIAAMNRAITKQIVRSIFAKD